MPKTIATIKFEDETVLIGNVGTYPTVDAIKLQVGANKNLQKYLDEYSELKAQVKNLVDEIASLKEEIKILKGE